MKINEIEAKRADKIKEMDELYKSAEEAKRNMNEDEVISFDLLKEEVRNLDVELLRAKELEQLNKSIVEKEIKNEMKNEKTERSLVEIVGENLRNGSIDNFELKRFNLSNASGAVDVKVGDLSVIGKKPIWQNMGVKHMPNLTTSFKLPYINPIVAGKVAEGATSINGESLGSYDFAPARYTVTDTFSKELLAAGNEAVVASIIEDLINGTERKVTADVYTQALASATEVATATSVTLTNLDKLQAGVDSDGLFIFPRSIFYTAKAVKIDTGSGKFLAEKQTNEYGNISDGTPLFYSSLFDGTQVIYGDMQGVVVGEWGYDITFDTISRAAEGEVKITVAKLANVKVRNPNAFTKSKLS